jgi:RPA family protein
MQRKNLTHALVPTCRVFFDEFLKSDFIVQENGMTVLVTPTCARCDRLFGVGEVKEVETRGNIARIKLTDLTASLTTYTNKSIHVGGVKTNTEEKKTFLAFLGNVHVREGAGKRNILLVEEVGTVEERVRNGWILTTAWRTMERIELLRSTISSKKEENVFSDKVILKEALEHYAINNDKLDALASTAINAVKTLWQHCHTTTNEMILDMVKKAGKSGIAHDKLVSELRTKGLKVEWAEEVIDELIMDGLCYETDRGVLKS